MLKYFWVREYGWRVSDGNNYPEPYLIINNYKLKFSRSKFDGEKILSDVIIEKIT